MRFNKKTYKFFLNSFLPATIMFSFVSFTTKLTKKANISSITKFGNNNWLDKYKNDKDFTNCDFFNAYKNSDLIKKALIKQFLYQTKLAFVEFQQYILKTYPNLKFRWIGDKNVFASSDKIIEFNQNYFNSLNKKIDWQKFFNWDTCDLKVTTNYLENEVISYFLCDDIKGVYYIDENNKNDEINQNIKKKISELKKKMNYAMKQLRAFIYSISQPFLSNNEELNSFLSQIVTNARKSLNHAVIIDEGLNKKLSESNKEEDYLVHKKFFDWIEDAFNITSNIAIEDYAFIAMNHFENFFAYLSSSKKNYLQGERIAFDKAIVDFLQIARKNFKIIALERAIVSYILAAQKNKTIVYFDLEEFIFKNWDRLMWQITGAVGVFGLTGLISSLISNTIVTTAAMGNNVSNTLTSWFSNFWGGFTNFFGDVGLAGGKTIFANGTKVTLPIVLSGMTAAYCANKINEKNIKTDTKTNDDNIINVDVDISAGVEENEINIEIERRMLQTLSQHGKSKKNYDANLDENMISDIDTKKVNEIKKSERNIKLQIDKSETNDKKMKKLIKQQIVKKFNNSNLVYYRVGNIDWVDVGSDPFFLKMIINHLKNFSELDEKAKSTIERIPFKWVLKAMLKIIKEENESEGIYFSDDQLVEIISSCFTQKIKNENSVNKNIDHSKDKIDIFDGNENGDGINIRNAIEKEEKNVIGEVQSNSNEDLISNKKENDNNSINTKEKLKTNITNKISTILNGVKVECWRNSIFKKNWNYKFNFASLPLLIQSKIKDSEKKEYIAYGLFLETIVKILKDDAQICSLFKNDELIFFVTDNLNKMLEENRKLNEGKNKFIIEKKDRKVYENKEKEKINDNNNIQGIQKRKKKNSTITTNLTIKNHVVTLIKKIFNNNLPIIWSDEGGNWIKVSSLPNEFQSKIKILLGESIEIKYVTLQLVLNITIQMLKDDMKINDYFCDDELEEIIVGLCNKKNIEISHFFPTRRNNYESGIAKIINLMSREVRYYNRFTGFSAHSLPFLEMKHIYYVLRLDTLRYEILQIIRNTENDRKFYKYVYSLSDQDLHRIFRYFLERIVLSLYSDFSFQYLDGVDNFTIIAEIDSIFANINNIINEIINNREKEIINYSTDVKEKKVICSVNYDKLREKLYKKYCVCDEHGQILNKHDVFSNEKLLSLISDFFCHRYKNFTIDIHDTN